MTSDLAPFFSPKGVAIIGASTNPRKLSHGILKNLKLYGYQGGIYPVNPGADEILGISCYPKISHVPDPVELAVVVLPAPMTPAILRDCGERGSKLWLSFQVDFVKLVRVGYSWSRNAAKLPEITACG